jgi:hypothetical protein
VPYPVAVNLSDLAALLVRHRDVVDRVFATWLRPGHVAERVQTEDGAALRLAPARDDAERRQLSGLIDLLARQLGPGQIGRPIRSYGFVNGRWCRIVVARAPRSRKSDAVPSRCTWLHIVA